MKKFFIAIILGLFLVTGCSSSSSNSINYVQAKEKIINEQAILIDVRTKEEFDSGHIDGAVLLSLDEINAESADNIIGNKENTVIVYCKSGKRSSQALSILNDLGYKNVYDLGAMSNWKE